MILTVLYECAELLAQTVDQLSGGDVELRVSVPDILRGVGGMRVGTEVSGKARRIGSTPESPLVRDVVEPLVLVARGGQGAFVVLEGDGVRVLGDLSGQTAGGDRPRLIAL